MTKYLNVPKEKLQSKGVASVKARVANMKLLDPSITVQSLSDALVERFQERHGSATTVDLSAAHMETEEGFAEVHQQMQDWEWRFGQTPKFEHYLSKRFPWGTIDLHVDSDNGMITDLKIYSDGLFPELVDGLTEALKDVPYHPSGVEEAKARADAHFDGTLVLQNQAREYLDWLATAL